MDLRFSPEDEQYRQKLRGWLEAHVPQERPPKDQDAEFAYRRAWQRQLYAGGLVGINWPKEYGGQGATLIQQAIYAQEMAASQRTRYQHCWPDPDPPWHRGAEETLHP